jgi:hypothetical protein
MQRRKAIISAASISLAFFSAATAMAVNTGLLLGPPPEGVGQLNAVSADAIGPAPTTVPVPPASPQTIIVTVPRSAVASTAAAPTPSTSAKRAPAVVPSPTATAPSATTVPPVTSSTVRTARTSTTVHWEDDEHDRETTSTTRPAGGEDDD